MTAQPTQQERERAREINAALPKCADRDEREALIAQALADAREAASFQARVHLWMMACFGLGADCDPDDPEFCCAPSRCDICKGKGCYPLEGSHEAE